MTDYTTLPAPARIQKTIQAVKARGVVAELIETKELALAKLRDMIPAGASLYTAASLTLQQIGFDDLLKSGAHPWRNLKAEMLEEKDPARQTILRRQGTLADYYLGSVHAVSETGEIVIASASGSQLPAYAYSSGHVIWVAGVQKITASLDDALQRVREYSLAMEDQRMKKAFGSDSGSFIGKMLIFEREAPYLRRSVTLLLINEVLGV